MRRSLLATAGVIAATSALLAGCSSTPESGDGGDSDEPFRVYAVAGLTGATQTLVVNARNSLDAWVEDVNADGGIDGRQVEVEWYDSQSDPTRAVTLLQEAIAEGRPDAVFAGLSSGETLAMLPVLTQEGIISIAQSGNPTMDDPATYPYHFGFTPTSINAVKLAYQDYFPEQGYDKVVALLGQDGFGDGNVAAFDAAFGGTDTEVEYVRYNPQDVDFTVAWQQAKDLNPDAIFAECLGEPCARLLASRLNAGATDIPAILGTGFVTTGGGPASYGDAESTENAVMTIQSFLEWLPEDERSPELQATYEAMSADGPLESTVVTGVNIRDAFIALKAAYEAAETNEADDVAAQFLRFDELQPVFASGFDIRFTEESHFENVPGMWINIPVSPLKDGFFDVQ